MTDTPNLVPDSDVLYLRQHLTGAVTSRRWYRLFFKLYLSREVSIEETDEILSKIDGLGPVEYKYSWAGIERVIA